MEVAVSSSHIFATPSASCSFPTPSEVPPWETVLHELLQRGSFPWHAVSLELLQYGSFPWVLSVGRSPSGMDCAIMGLPWGHGY